MEYDNDTYCSPTGVVEQQQNHQQMQQNDLYQQTAQQPAIQPTVHTPKKSAKQNNALPLWGNEASMNLNALILANIQGSSYFKVSLFKLKTYHEVVDEIYYQVKHLEPWERGSRKTAGQTGMCGGVRGVGAGGIVSTAFCLLYKLYTLRLTRKQINGLLTHGDSPYIRALGFMYLRYTQPPSDLFDWYEPYLLDDEEIDVKAGSGQTMTIGNMIRQWLTKLDWFSTLFPRIPVPIQKQIDAKLSQYALENNVSFVDTQPDRGGASTSVKHVRGSVPSGRYGATRSIPSSFADDREPTRYDRGSAEQSLGEKSAKREMFDHCNRDARPSRYERSDEDSSQRREYRNREEKDCHRHRSRDRDRDRVRDRDRDRDRVRDRDRDHQRDKDRYRERHRVRGQDYDRKDRIRSDHRSRSLDRDNNRERRDHGHDWKKR